MGRGITKEDNIIAAYAMGKTRQQSWTSLALIVINIMMILFLQGKLFGFNFAIILISAVSFFANVSYLRKIEKKYSLSEAELISESNNLIV